MQQILQKYLHAFRKLRINSTHAAADLQLVLAQ